MCCLCDVVNGMEATRNKYQKGNTSWLHQNITSRSCDFSFIVHSTKWKKIDEDSVIFRRILKFDDECRRFPTTSRRCFDHISDIYPRVQGPKSRVQSPESIPVQSPVHVLDCAHRFKRLFVSFRRPHMPAMRGPFILVSLYENDNNGGLR